MEIRFGKFPDDHHFIQITRPIVEQSFKVLGWLVVIATLRFAYFKTNSATILYVEWFFELLMLAYVGAFVDWVLSFKRNLKNRSDAVVVRKRWHWWLVILATIVLVGIANTLVERIISAFLEFQQATK
jgi:hypothetical protein